jgi:hypothetical protein
MQQWANSEARARLRLQAEGKLDKPVFGVHYDTPENNFDFECVSPDTPIADEDDDDDGECVVMSLRPDIFSCFGPIHFDAYN